MSELIKSFLKLYKFKMFWEFLVIRELFKAANLVLEIQEWFKLHKLLLVWNSSAGVGLGHEAEKDI